MRNFRVIFNLEYLCKWSRGSRPETVVKSQWPVILEMGARANSIKFKPITKYLTALEINKNSLQTLMSRICNLAPWTNIKLEKMNRKKDTGQPPWKCRICLGGNFVLNSLAEQWLLHWKLWPNSVTETFYSTHGVIPVLPVQGWQKVSSHVRALLWFLSGHSSKWLEEMVF